MRNGLFMLFILLFAGCTTGYVVNYNKGIDEYKKGNLKNALLIFRSVRDEHPDYAPAYYGLGLIYTRLGNYPQAESAFAKAVELDKKSPEYRWALGLTYYQERDIRKAVECLESAYSISKDPKIALELGIISRKAKEYERAFKYLEIAAGSFPNEPAPLENIALVYEEQGIYDSAREYWQKALKLEKGKNWKEIQSYLDALKEWEQDKYDPVISILSPADGITVMMDSVVIKGVAFDDRKVSRVVVNGREVEKERGIAVIPSGIHFEPKSIVSFSVKVPLLEGENIITCEVYDGLNKYSTASVKVIRGATIAKKELVRPRLFGVFIGIDKFVDRDVPALKYAVNDAKALYRFFNYQKDLFKEVNLQLIAGKDATRKKIIKALAYELGKASPEDVVIVFIAGHGYKEGGEYYFLPYDADLSNLFGTGIGEREFEGILKRIKSRRLLLFTDTCHSGGILLAERGMTERRFFEELAKAQGRVAITASDFSEVSYERKEFKHGLFTYYLLKALRGTADVNKDGIITITEIYRYISTKIPEMTRGDQHPQLLLPEGKLSGDIPVAMVEKGR